MDDLDSSASSNSSLEDTGREAEGDDSDDAEDVANVGADANATNTGEGGGSRRKTLDEAKKKRKMMLTAAASLRKPLKDVLKKLDSHQYNDTTIRQQLLARLEDLERIKKTSHNLIILGRECNKRCLSFCPGEPGWQSRSRASDSHPLFFFFFFF